MKNGHWRPFGAVGIIASGLCLLTAIFSLGLTEQNAASRDFIGYWAAGQQIVHGASPYDAGNVLRMEKAVGLGNLQIKITPSPPIGLALGSVLRTRFVREVSNAQPGAEARRVWRQCDPTVDSHKPTKRGTRP